MRIPIDQIAAASKSTTYTEDVGELNARLAHGAGALRAGEGLAVDLCYYRAGLDIVFEGVAHGDGRATCGRCLEDYLLPIRSEFRVVLSPRAAADERDGEVSEDDIGRGTYDGDEIDVTALVHEHVILSLPTRQLCGDDCRGLCPTCGTNRNTTTCECPTEGSRPRLAILHDLVRGRSANS